MFESDNKYINDRNIVDWSNYKRKKSLHKNILEYIMGNYPKNKGPFGMDDLTTYAKHAGINPRKAQRYREKIKIGKKIAGRWILTDIEWLKLERAIVDTKSAQNGRVKP